MPQEWDDILLEPVAQLQPDLPAAEGGWRAVRSIDEVSPRPQQPPLTLPDPDGMLSIRLPVQPEEATPSSVPPPPSLTDQLSLTWASRRKGRRKAAEEVARDNWPDWEPSVETAPQPVQPSWPVVSWLKPLQRIVRRFRRGAEDEHHESEPAQQPRVLDEVPAIARAPAISREAPAEPPPTVQAPKLSLEGGAEMPMAL